MKGCLNCNKELILPETTNNYLRSNFRLRKFCDDSCRVEFNNKKNKKNYVLKETEHNNKLKEINSFIHGTIMHIKGKKDYYNPDITKENIDYEVEMFRNLIKMKKKAKNWDNSRKHVLIIALSEQIRDFFDEVYFFNNNSLIKEK
jgi:hypothetical protein